MRIQTASDLHQEFVNACTPGSESLALAQDIDLLILAGDIHTRTQVLSLYGSYSVPVLYVHGNHGHAHRSADYKVGECRVIGCPCGFSLIAESGRHQWCVVNHVESYEDKTADAVPGAADDNA
ncbi:hypothetical protein SBC2_08790 [Caballeronia sp. SBC2]|nr:hypothetical protein SBC2_08790 [Caballeronia sp. SBC2]